MTDISYDPRQAQGEISKDEQAGQPQKLWMPIETAPKDGSLIMIGGTGYAGWFWADAKWSAGWMMWSSEDDEWNVECYEATHWMPLPAPPVTRPNLNSGS